MAQAVSSSVEWFAVLSHCGIHLQAPSRVSRTEHERSATIGIELEQSSE